MNLFGNLLWKTGERLGLKKKKQLTESYKGPLVERDHSLVLPKSGSRRKNGI